MKELPSFDWFSTQTTGIRVSPHKHSFITKHHCVIFAWNNFLNLFAFKFLFSYSYGSFDRSIKSAYYFKIKTFDFWPVTAPEVNNAEPAIAGDRMWISGWNDIDWEFQRNQTWYFFVFRFPAQGEVVIAAPGIHFPVGCQSQSVQRSTNHSHQLYVPLWKVFKFNRPLFNWVVFVSRLKLIDFSTSESKHSLFFTHFKSKSFILNFTFNFYN